MRVNDRKSSIELLRIITMLGVVILHYNAKIWEISNTYLLNKVWMHFSESMFICAVDLFIMVSGYFLIDTQRRKLIKVIELVIQVILFQFAFYFGSICLGKSSFSINEFIRCILPDNYFMILYSVLYLMSPYINIVIDKLNKKQLYKLCGLSIAIFSIWTFIVDLLGNIDSMSSVGLKGSQSGYTIVNFMLCYIIGAFVKRNDIKLNIKSKIVLLILNLMVTFGISFVTKVAWNYNSPFVIGIAIIVLSIFKDINFTNSIINEFSKSTFTCYLFHQQVLTLILEKQNQISSFPILVFYQLIIAISLYVISYVIFKIYNILSKRIFVIIGRKMDVIDIYLFEK